MARTILGIAFFLISAVVSYAGQDLGVAGNTYAVAEQDAIVATEEAMRRVDWKKVLAPEETRRKLLAYRPEGLKPVPRSNEDSIYRVALVHTLDIDIPDGKGGVLYPRGYTYNPLAFIRYPQTMVFLDGADNKQLEWFESSEYASRYDLKVLLTDGSFYDIRKRLNRHVYYSDDEIQSKFRVDKVPAVVRQVGQELEVRVYAIR